MKTINFLKISLCLFLLLSNVNLLQAQDPPPDGGLSPLDIPSTTTPPAGLDGFEGRINDLRDAGVSDGEIQNYFDYLIKKENGDQYVPPQNDPPSKPEQKRDEKIEDIADGEEVMDEEADFEDKPEEAADDISTPKAAPIFGHNLFREKAKFEQISPTNPPADYIIGMGDQFNVTVFGAGDYNGVLTVQNDGSVYQRFIGKLYVAGFTYQAARDIIARKFRGITPGGSKIEVVLSPQSREIQVSVVGEVAQPGFYSVAAINTAFNVLYTSGGPLELGTVRNIYVKREGQVIANLDLYKYLLEGAEEPIYLESNDFVFVPVRGNVVEVEGNVKRPMRYELKDNERLSDLIKFAGGLKYDSKLSNVKIIRLENEKEVLIDVDLEELLSQRRDFKLKDGDKVIISKVLKGAYNIVQIDGEVQYPGKYQMLPGERISDLIGRAGGLGSNAYMKRAYVVRIAGAYRLQYIPIDLTNIVSGQDTANNIRLQYFDAVRIFSEKDFSAQKTIEARGYVRRPGIYLTSPSMTLKDLLFLAGGPKNEADFDNVILSKRTRARDIDTESIRLEAYTELERNVIEELNLPGSTPPEQTEDPEESVPTVNPDDIDSSEDLPPDDTAPGDSEVVETPETDDFSPTDPPDVDTDFTGSGVEDQVIRRVAISPTWQTDPSLDTVFIGDYNSVTIYSKYSFIFPQYVEIDGAVRRPGKYQVFRGMSLKDLLFIAGGLNQKADLANVELHKVIPIQDKDFSYRSDKKQITRINLDKDWRNSMLADSIQLGLYQKVVIRTIDEFVTKGSVEIKGMVRQPGKYTLAPNMTLKDLLYASGGLRPEADYENIELVRVFDIKDDETRVEPIPVRVKHIPTIQDWQNDSDLDSIIINAFDQIYVRRNPNFRLQQSVYVFGEVRSPGEYAKKEYTERASSIIERSGSLTKLAYPEGAFIKRPGIGNISIRLDKALRRPGSKYDIILQPGDELIIPQRLDVVFVEGNVLVPNSKFMFEKNHRKLKYYVNQAGGFEKYTIKRKTNVRYVDGRVKRAKSILGFKSYPKIDQGAVITVPRRKTKDEKQAEREAEKDGDNNRQRVSFQEVIAGTTALVTLILLIRQSFQ